MKIRIFLMVILLYILPESFAKDKSLIELLNSVVGGTWISHNEQNQGNPEDFNIFYMRFFNWADKESVRGDIYGIKNNGDTVQLMEIWNFINKAENNIFLVQRTTWGETSVGTVIPYHEKHLDIQFKSTTAEGEQYYIRDIHYLNEQNEMTAVTYHKLNEADDWRKIRESTWKRVKDL